MEETGGLVDGHCPACGPVTLPSSELVCGLSATDELGLCEFGCPGCGRLLLHRLLATALGPLLLHGARLTQTLPFELLEPHSGPPISWDEILNVHYALERHCRPAAEIAPGESGGEAAA